MEGGGGGIHRDVRLQILIWFQTFLLFTKCHFQTFNALKSTSFQAFQIISEDFRLFLTGPLTALNPPQSPFDVTLHDNDSFIKVYQILPRITFWFLIFARVQSQETMATAIEEARIETIFRYYTNNNFRDYVSNLMQNHPFYVLIFSILKSSRNCSKGYEWGQDRDYIQTLQ